MAAILAGATLLVPFEMYVLHERAVEFELKESAVPAVAVDRRGMAEFSRGQVAFAVKVISLP